MLWKTTHYQVARTRKEAKITLAGGYEILLSEVFNSKGLPMPFGFLALLVKDGKEVDKRYYGEKTREEAISDLRHVAEGYICTSIDLSLDGRTHSNWSKPNP